jgi:hypothetical protein
MKEQSNKLKAKGKLNRKFYSDSFVLVEVPLHYRYHSVTVLRGFVTNRSPPFRTVLHRYRYRYCYRCLNLTVTVMVMVMVTETVGNGGER